MRILVEQKTASFQTHCGPNISWHADIYLSGFHPPNPNHITCMSSTRHRAVQLYLARKASRDLLQGPTGQMARDRTCCDNLAITGPARIPCLPTLHGAFGQSMRGRRACGDPGPFVVTDLIFSRNLNILHLHLRGHLL